MRLNLAYLLRKKLQERQIAVRSAPTPGSVRVYDKSTNGMWGCNWFFTHKLPHTIKTKKRCWSAERPLEVWTIAGHQRTLPRKGDEFHVPVKSGKVGRFVVVQIRYPGDPPDMFFAEVKMAGYVAEEACPATK
jgi:hypothetical protein